MTDGDGSGTRYQATSERLSEDEYQSSPADFLIYCCHLATYDHVLPLVAGKRVLDFGCGTGYGTHRLAPHCAEIVGVDISADAVAFAGSRYQAPNLEYRQIGRLPESRVPFDDASFDVVVSFQVMEHIWEVDAYVDELARLVRPSGTVMVVTPDRTTRLFRGQRPWNLYHVIEYDGEGLRAALARRFADVQIETMTATPGVVEIELRRCRAVRVATLPFTFPHAPEAWRTFGLRMMKRVQARRSAKAGAAPAGGAAPDHGFGVDDVSIGADATPSMNVIATCRRPT
jgi:SAM-dependent methyltransferase